MSKQDVIDMIVDGIGKQEFADFYNGLFLEYIEGNLDDPSETLRKVKAKIVSIFQLDKQQFDVN